MTILSRAFRLVTVLAPPNDDSRELIPRKTSACYSAQTNTTPSLRQTDRAEGRPPGRGIRVVDTRHEAPAVFAADATARLTGRPVVAAVTAGPTGTNTLTAVKNAQMAQSPVVVIGGTLLAVLNPHTAMIFDVVSYVHGFDVLSSIPHGLAAQA